MSASLSRLLNAKSLAFVGGNECAIAIRRTLELGFRGKIWAVHPKREELSGIRTVASVAEIDGELDAAFVAVKREPTIDVVRQLRAKNCGGAVIYAAGFAEAGADGLQAELLKAADGMPLLGPNCYGFVNTLSNYALWPDEHGMKRRARGVAIITQSGNIACNFTFTRRALPLAAIFAIGNQADVDIARLLEALAQDDRVTAIGLHIEGLKDVAAFARACAVARQHGKCVVALKTGRSEQGAKTALSHTSSLAGADQLYDALFRRCGVARVTTITQMVETLKFLHGGALKDGKLVSLSCSGGEAGLAADLALGHKVRFPPFDKATHARVKATLNEFVAIDNPLDYHTFIWGDEEKLRKNFTAVLSGGFDCGMLILDMPTQGHLDSSAWKKTARAFVAAARANDARAAVVSTLPECMPEDLAEELIEQGVTPLFGLDDALSAMESAILVGTPSGIRRANVVPPGFAVLPHAAREGERKRVLSPSRRARGSTLKGGGGVETLSEFDSKQLLAKFGLTIPKGSVCKAKDAVKAANKIGYPVTLKVSSASVAHKTEKGGVILNLKSAAEVKAAARKLGKIAPELLVEKMVTGAVCELIIGIKRDPQFGLALVIGAGGVLTELLKDSTSLLLPTTPAEIRSACERLKVWQLVKGFRGKKGDAHAVCKAIVAVAKFATLQQDALEELDVNPLLVLPDGAVAVDALIRLRR